jgi:AraC-like DNA-binding protein
MATPATLTTPSGWSAAIVRALDAAGRDGRDIAARAGIAAAVLDDPNGRVPRQALTALWQLAVEATGDESFGLTAARFATHTTLHALGLAALASATLLEALERMIRFRRVIGAVNQVRLEDAGDRYRFVIDVSAPPGVPYPAVDAFAAGVVRQMRSLTGDRRFAPLAVTLKRPRPANDAPFAQTFRAPVIFAAAENVIELDKVAMERRLPTANAELAAQNDRVLLEYLARIESTRLASRVERALVEALPSGVPSQAELARRLGVSTRGLQRQLVAEGTTFRAILDAARAALARDYVRAGTLSVTEIAFLLGFSETSAFSRAFRRWTGMAPRRFHDTAAER